MDLASLPRCRFHMKRHVYTLSYMSPSSSATVSVKAATTAILKIMGYLDGKSRRSCRLVCQAWKKVLDEEIGLWLTLNEKKYKEENGSFCRSVLLERLTVQYVFKFRNFVTLKFPERLKMLRCIGPVDSDWFKGQLLLKCRNLVRLDLSGRFLQSQELCPQTPWITALQATAAVASPWYDGIIADLPEQKPKINHHVTFPLLKCLIISYSNADFQAYNLKVNGSGPLQAIWGTIIGSRFEAIYLLKQVIDTNVSYILNTVRSLCLQTLYISVDGMHLEEDKTHPGWTYRWKRESLKSFLETHRHTLRRLYLPQYSGDTRKEDKTFPLFPCDLVTLEVSLIQKGDRRNTRFMEKLLLVQTELEELRLDKHYIGHSLTQWPSLVSVIQANELTLTFVHLTLSIHDREFMDGRLYSQCKVLQTLIIERVHDRLTFRNVSKLPESLRHIQIHVTVWLESLEILDASKFRNLQILVLDDLLLEATGSNKHFQLLQLIKNILHMRRLDHLHLDTKESTEDTPCLKVNGIIHALCGSGSGMKTVESSFSDLQIHPIWSCRQSPMEECRHFLDSDPIFRSEVDPTKGHGPGLYNLDTRSQCQELLVRSNVFQARVRANGTDNGEEDDETEDGDPWCDFCYTLFDIR